MKRLLAATLAAAALIEPMVGVAATATANLSVTASVATNCTISTTPVAFGAYDPLAATDVNGTGTVVVRCTKGASGLSIGLGNGASFSTTRRMTNGTDFLGYSLFQPPNNTPGTACSFPGTTAWGNTVGTNTLALTNSPSSAARTYNVCGTIPNSQDVGTGSYTDTVVATINF